jgi:hypothetical protein
VEFEPTTLVFERAKVVHALDCASTVIGSILISLLLMSARFIIKIRRMIVGTPIFKVTVVQWGYIRCDYKLHCGMLSFLIFADNTVYK